MDAKTLKVLGRIRKGTVTTVSAPQMALALEACGFSVAAYRTDTGKAHSVTAPDAAAYDWCKASGSLHLFTDDVVRWANEHGLRARACELLGLPSIEDEQAAKALAKKTTERRFTCPCCFGEYKIGENPKSPSFGGLVNHGYERPGYGYIVGGCVGVDMQPYEVSCAGTRLMLVEYARPALEREEARLARLKNRPVTFHFQGLSYDKIKDTRRFNRALDRAINESKGLIYTIKQDIELLEAKIASWAPTHERFETEAERAGEYALAYSPKKMAQHSQGR